jgi:hypothetical protein
LRIPSVESSLEVLRKSMGVTRDLSVAIRLVEFILLGDVTMNDFGWFMNLDRVSPNPLVI